MTGPRIVPELACADFEASLTFGGALVSPED